jgi:hypothetical protein
MRNEAVFGAKKGVVLEQRTKRFWERRKKWLIREQTKEAAD